MMALPWPAFFPLHPCRTVFFTCVNSTPGADLLSASCPVIRPLCAHGLKAGWMHM